MLLEVSAHTGDRVRRFLAEDLMELRHGLFGDLGGIEHNISALFNSRGEAVVSRSQLRDLLQDLPG